jgi:hypothetical protein
MAMSGSGVEKNALNNSGQAVGQATTAYNTVNPIYSAMAKDPQGLTPVEKANSLTASEQSTGGGVASAVGQGGLMAARTGNAGGATAALDDASRMAGVTNSANALDVQNRSDQLATQNQRLGLAGVNGIYQDANKTGEGYLNIADSSQQAAARNKLGWTNLALKTAATAAGA